MEARVWEEDHASDADYQEPPFEISTDPATGFAIRERVRTSDPRRQNMLRELLGRLPHEPLKIAPADHMRPFRFRADGDNGPDAICDTREIQALRPRPAVAADKEQRDPISITIAELEAVAKTLDDEDARDQTRIPRNFLTRLRSVEGAPVFSVLSPRGGRLTPDSAISLDGVSHMIGLPGAGKSTLIFLLVVALSRQGRRVTLLVPSIEFALALDADLSRYSVPTALLVGQSPDARRSHASRLRPDAAEAHGRHQESFQVRACRPSQRFANGPGRKPVGSRGTASAGVITWTVSMSGGTSAARPVSSTRSCRRSETERGCCVWRLRTRVRPAWRERSSAGYGANSLWSARRSTSPVRTRRIPFLTFWPVRSAFPPSDRFGQRVRLASRSRGPGHRRRRN